MRVHNFVSTELVPGWCTTCGEAPWTETHGESAATWTCGCAGCWACAGGVRGCTCDVDWDEMTERKARMRGRTSWSCPSCPWVHKAHPLYGWAWHDDRAVEVHQTMLCSAADKGGDES